MASTRRSFVSRLAGASALLSLRPAALLGSPPPARFMREDGLPLAPEGGLPAEFWAELRKEFLIPPGEAFFNTGTLGSSPRIVREAVINHMNHVDRDIAHWDYKKGNEYYFSGYNPEDELRAKLARLINASGADEIALTQNATFGMNFLANGLQLNPGDEVVIMEGAHPGGRCGWELRDKRFNIEVKFVAVPPAPANPGELTRLFEQATTARTKVWAIPHLSSSWAIRFPVEEMCRRARERGIFSAIDGAQTLGHLAIDVRALGCDAFFTSPHKWLLAPKGTGFLYLRKDVQSKVWTTLASTEWDNQQDGAYRFMQYGTGNLSLLHGLDKAIDFHNAIGSKRVEERILGLADRLRAGLQQIKGARILSALHPAMRSATTIWGIEGKTGQELQDLMWERGRVRVRSMGDHGVRHCCHIYNSEEEVDRALRAARSIAA